MRIVFTCGHTADLPDTITTPPVCGCGERQITRVQVRAPRFVGACRGPYAETKSVEPAIVTCGSGSLVKTQE